MVFDDEKWHWKTAREHWRSTTCEEKKSQASSAHALNIVTQRKDDVTIDVREHLRPRFWYMTFVACGLSLRQPLHYEIHAFNPLMGWQAEVSVDQTGVFMMYAVFTVLFVVAYLVN